MSANDYIETALSIGRSYLVGRLSQIADEIAQKNRALIELRAEARLLEAQLRQFEAAPNPSSGGGEQG